MALKDLVSDLSNFNGRSQYDKLDTQIKEGVDFIPNTDAPGFTPKTDLESLYNKVQNGTIAPAGGEVAPYANLNPVEDRKSSFGDSDRQWPINQTTPPKGNTNYDNLMFRNAESLNNSPPSLGQITINGIGEFSLNNQPGGFSVNNPQYSNIGDDILLPTPNLFDFQAFRERGRTSETPPFHSSVNAPFSNVELPNIFSPSGYGVEFGLDGGTNLRDRYKDGSIHIFSDDVREPIGGRVSMFAILSAGNHRLANPMLSQFSSPNIRDANNISTKPEGFIGAQTSLNLPKEVSRIVEGEPLFDTFSNTESDGLNIITLKKEYGENKSIKDLFEFRDDGRDTFKNVPSGINDKGNFGSTDFRTIANKGPFDGNSTHPIILRKPGSNWDNVLNESVIGGTAGNVVAGALGVVGLLTRTSVGLADKARVFKFMISGKGISFVAKQAAFQLLNPTLESKLYNPLSTLGIAGASDLLQGNLSGLLRAAGSFLFPTHVERHLPNVLLVGNPSRYEDFFTPDSGLSYESGEEKYSRLAFQSKAFRIMRTSTQVPQSNTGIGIVDNVVNNVVSSVTNAVQAAALSPTFVMSNPNKYFFPISSAPKSVKNGRPSFLGTALDLGISDVSNAITKKGATFNDKSAINDPAVTDNQNKRFHTSAYSELIEELSYTKTMSMPASSDFALDRTFSNKRETRLNEKKINDNIGSPGKRPTAMETLGLKSNLLGGYVQTDLGRIHSPGADKVNLHPYGSKQLEESTYAPGLKDFIKFSFYDKVNKKYIIFRAILDGISDTITPDYSEEKYIGRPDKVYTYQGADRSVSFNFSIYPKTKQELPVLMEKLNYLVGLCYPSFTPDERMVSPMIELSLGDMFNKTSGLLFGLTVTVEDQSTWEITDGLQFPHFIKAACEFKYIGDNVLTTKGKHYGLKWIPSGKTAPFNTTNDAGVITTTNRFTNTKDLGYLNYPNRKDSGEKDFTPIFSDLGQP